MTDYIEVDDGGGRHQKIPVDLPSNSHKSKAGKPPPAVPRKVEKVVTGEVVRVPAESLEESQVFHSLR